MKNIFSYFYGSSENKNSEIKDPKLDQQFETFIFEFTSNEYFPVYEKWTKGEEQEYIDYKLQDIEDIYLNNYDQQLKFQQEEKNLVDYIVQEDDTLFGLELKFNINQNRILKINDISQECFVPGMKIKIPIVQQEQNQGFFQESETNDFQLNQSSFYGRNLMDEIMSRGQTKKFNVYYVTNYGCIEGVLTVNSDVILFDPSFVDRNKELVQKCHKQSILNFQACLMTDDVISVDLNELPMRIAKSSSKCFKDYLVMVHVSANVSCKKLLEVLPILTFRIQNDDDQKEFKIQSIDLCETLADVVKTKSERMLDEQKKKEQDLTIIPFYDIQDSTLTEKFIERTNQLWGGQDFIPQMVSESQILDNDEMIQIIAYVPSIFKTSNWKLIFSNVIHGSSYLTLLNNCENHSPLILAIKDFNECKFGAYLNESPQLTYGKFFGNGETFLWTFKQNDFKTYNWTEANNYFIFCESDGLAVGCGEKFGLYVNHSLMNGNTNTCETYKNEILSISNDFSIQILEIWGLSE
ncbi:unnamed protein product [Paramecium pentaurelia]|uniref:Oxidation resistance protein 1 n=1 Tax=Paramecium pentaurelia TaxID=43138 RepID=A0A8S1UL81_9CILI|nr:unnamed protein product [Paramecium pentaurelia]